MQLVISLNFDIDESDCQWWAQGWNDHIWMKFTTDITISHDWNYLIYEIHHTHAITSFHGI